MPAELDASVDVVFCAVGTGGTLAGVAAALRPDQLVIGVPVLKSGAFLEGRHRWAARAGVRRTHWIVAARVWLSPRWLRQADGSAGRVHRRLRGAAWSAVELGVRSEDDVRAVRSGSSQRVSERYDDRCLDQRIWRSSGDLRTRHPATPGATHLS
ncbi:pyridoxal-phosphate dependent enzyme [Kribbella pittospori]|uniref:Pyridoxal-phosphate dependent enzyme n=1 Tax=Kribbella pittospori TaxID=722689 RepID=A0A4R0JF08_9ACTN|nr:pyridoxal-phosphate dependent enzyme [Kribbella pittospori]